eukprot:gb/GFBE01074753.1/.p1 GENE.gb/GFBE01074753.1/~~gb/GFBE01074753.1/.p1  ORF type:complete len:412 (+),score=97.87 gb/GFBE01074753.1/:1-1236(+)
MKSALCALGALLLAHEARGIKHRSSSGSRAAAELARMFADIDDWDVNCRIFTMWDYPNGVPYYIEKDLQSWAFHSKNRCGYPVKINDTNVREYIPDLPEEYFRLPDHGSRSDIIRYALLYHHGGMYLDSDMIVAQDMDDIIWKVKQDYDLISYTNHEHCQMFSSNFLAGRKGSPLHKAIWEEQKKALATPCPAGKQDSKQVCCSSNPKDRCHVPWGGVGERVSHPVFDEFVKQNRSMKTFCYEEKNGESFVPEGWGTVLFSKPKLEEGMAQFESQKTKKPMDRVMYHLFSAQGFQSEYDGPGIFDENFVIGQIFRKALGKFITLPEPEDGGLPSHFCADDGSTCECNGKVFLGRKFLSHRTEGDRLGLRDMLVSMHRVKEVNGSITCTAKSFDHGDPQSGRAKQCICQPHQ